MKAIVHHKYGSPDVLELQEVDEPVAADDEVLVRVHAASLNILDWYGISGLAIGRIGGGLRRPKDPRVGVDFAGVVEGVGANVKLFKPGDEVYGGRGGSFAEYVTIREQRGIAPKPASVTFEQAATVPVAGLTALQGLRDKGQIQPGQKVLINGASGGVGIFAVQIAKSYGTEVTGVCSTRNLEMVRSIGADHVVDYTKEDFTRKGQQYDLIFDAVGNLSVSDYQRALSPNGICSVAGFTTMSLLFQDLLLGAWVSKTGSQKIGRMETVKPNKKDLVVIKELLEAGKVVPVIDRTY